MARRFVFDLQAVLDQRQRVEEEHQRRVGAIERERVSVEERLRGLQQAILSAKADLRRDLTPPSHPGAAPAATTPRPATRVVVQSVRLQSTASAQLALRAQQTVLELAGVHKRLEGARKSLAAASAARKAVELLRSRRLAEWKRAMARAEHAELDELVVMRAGRREDRL